MIIDAQTKGQFWPLTLIFGFVSTAFSELMLDAQKRAIALVLGRCSLGDDSDAPFPVCVTQSVTLLFA